VAGAGFDRLVFRFLGDDPSGALDQLATGECDVLDESLLPLADLEQTRASVESAGAELQLVAGSVVDRLEFALQPAVNSEYRRLLDQLELRQALATCIDRAGIAEALFGQAANVPVSFIPADHPQSLAEPAGINYDPASAREMLDDLGWLAPEEGAIRVALGVDGLANDTPLAFTAISLPGDLQVETLDLIQGDLAECGIGLEIETTPAEQLFQTWPDGPLFGRRFQMALWAWPNFQSPACEMFASWEFPSDENPLGINAAGFNSPAYDSACRTVLSSPSGTNEYDQAVARIQQEFVAGLPALPLYARPRQLAYADWLCGPEPNGSASTMYWNLEEWAPCP
jgi:peptide/nickel transport system substrate-binding protein